MTMDKTPLTFEARDEYGRKRIAERLLNAIAESADISPLMISGSWGSGKTEFIKKTIALMETTLNQTSAVYVDAYKNDYHEDPLLAVSAAVLDAVPPEKKEAVKKKLLPVLKATGKLGLKVLSSWVLKQDVADVAEDFDKDFKKAADSASDAIIESMLMEQTKSAQNIEELRTVLGEVTVENELVIFIDELDRCKPDFAVHLLELVKHIFDMQGIKFVFAANREQLESSIVHHYGNGMDAKRYLDKFISFSVSLPERLKDHGDNDTHIGHAHFDTRLKLYPELSNAIGCADNQSYLYNTIKAMCFLDNLSLREVETFIRYLNVYQQISKDAHKFDRKDGVIGAARAFAIYLTCFHPSKAHAITLENHDFDSVFSMFKKTPIFEFNRATNDGLDMLCMALFVHSRKQDFVPENSIEAEFYATWVKELDGIGGSVRFNTGSFDSHWAFLHALKIMSFNDE